MTASPSAFTHPSSFTSTRAAAQQQCKPCQLCDSCSMTQELVCIATLTLTSPNTFLTVRAFLSCRHAGVEEGNLAKSSNRLMLAGDQKLSNAASSSVSKLASMQGRVQQSNPCGRQQLHASQSVREVYLSLHGTTKHAERAPVQVTLLEFSVIPHGFSYSLEAKTLSRTGARPACFVMIMKHPLASPPEERTRENPRRVCPYQQIGIAEPQR